MGRLGRLTLVALAIALFVAAPAFGATQYASPSGSDVATDCTVASAPCSLVNAFTRSANNDEISLAAGTYSPITQLGMGRTGLDVHGPLGTQSARINADIGGAALTIDTGHLHDLSISNSAMSGWAVQAQGAGTGTAGVVENVEIDTSTATGIKIGSEAEPGIPVLRNSVVTASGAPAVWTQGNALIQNVDAYASAGPSAVGMLLSGGGTTSVVVDVVNSIARGSDSSHDMVLNDGSMHATVNVSYSDTHGVTGDATTFGQVNTSNNITADPQLVNPTLGGDFHETALSPTIDKGIATGIGGVDLDWQPRIIGSAPDIGADERALAPSGSTDPATNVSPGGGTLNGTLNSNGLVTDYHFEYGVSPTSLGSTAGAGQLPVGATPQAVSAPLSALAAGTTVYYRVVGSNPQGAFQGSVLSFKTTGGAPPPGGGTTKLRVKFKAARQHLKSHKLVFTLTSPSALKASGKVTLKGKTLAKFSKRLHTGANKVTVKLNKKALKALTRALKKHKTLSLRLRVTPTGATAQTFALKLTR